MEPTMSSQKPNLLYYWSVIRGHWPWIISLVFVAVSVSFIISRFSPRLYESTAVILPSLADHSRLGIGLPLAGEEGSKEKKEEGSSLDVVGLFGQAASTTDLMKSILNSRTMAYALIEQLNLKAYYGTESMVAARAMLKRESTIMVNREKAFNITVLSRDRQMATDIANAYASNLDRLNRMLSVTSASRNRMFIERRLAEKHDELSKTEEERKQFQIANKTLLITDAAKAAMTAASMIEGNILDLEVQLEVLKGYATSSHPMMNQLEAEIQTLRKQLDRLEQRQSADVGGTARKRASSESFSKEFYTPALEVPGLALEFIRLSRAVRIQESVVSMLTGQYEHAKIAEARDTPTVQVLDAAIPAETHSRPRTVRDMQIAGMIALLLGIMLALFIDHVKRLKSQIVQPINDLSRSGPSETILPVSAVQPEGNGSAYPPGVLEPKPQHKAF